MLWAYYSFKTSSCLSSSPGPKGEELSLRCYPVPSFEQKKLKVREKGIEREVLYSPSFLLLPLPLSSFKDRGSISSSVFLFLLFPFFPFCSCVKTVQRRKKLLFLPSIRATFERLHSVQTKRRKVADFACILLQTTFTRHACAHGQGQFAITALAKNTAQWFPNFHFFLLRRQKNIGFWLLAPESNSGQRPCEGVPIGGDFSGVAPT